MHTLPFDLCIRQYKYLWGVDGDNQQYFPTTEWYHVTQQALPSVTTVETIQDALHVYSARMLLREELCTQSPEGGSTGQSFTRVHKANGVSSVM